MQQSTVEVLKLLNPVKGYSGDFAIEEYFRDCYSCYDKGPPRGAVEEWVKNGTFFDARTFLRVIMSFCLSPSTSANWRLSWEYRSCISFNSVSTAEYLPLISNMSLISSLMSLKLLNTASSSLCCFKKELEHKRIMRC